MKAVAVTLLLSLSCLAQTTITGTFRYPDGTGITGRIVILGTATSVCSITPTATTRLPATVSLVNGSMGLVRLQPTSCLSPPTPYAVRVYDRLGKLLYSGTWTVPNSGYADVTTLKDKGQ